MAPAKMLKTSARFVGRRARHSAWLDFPYREVGAR